MSRVLLPRPVRWVTAVGTGRDQWLQARRSGLGGSDVATLAGSNQFRSPFQVWLEKTGRLPDAPDAGESAVWGSVLEDAVARRWAAGNGHRLRRAGMLADLEHPWRLASLDRCIVVPGTYRAAALVEVKTTSQRAGEALDDEELEARYRVQVQWYLGLTGLDEAHLVLLVGGQRLRAAHMRADRATIDGLTNMADDWWHAHVVADVPPPLTAVDHGWTKHLPETDPPTTATRPDATDLATDLATATAARKAAEAAEEKAKADLQAAMGGASILLDTAGRTVATWRTTTSSRIDPARLRREHPDIAAGCMTTTSSRRLLLTRGEQT